MKKTKKTVIASITVLLCVITLLLVAVPIVRYRAYYSDVPVFMGNPFMQRLIYHDTDVVMLPGEQDTVVYNGNVYVGDYDTDWLFEDEKMQYAGKIHYRKILHFYCNYNVYVSKNAVTEQGIPIYLSLQGVQPFYYVLEGYEAPDIMTSELCWTVCGQSLPDTAKLEETVDMHAVVSYNADMKKVCTATLSSAELDFLHDYADVYAYDGRYYLRMGTDTLYPIINEDLIGCIEQARVPE